MDWLLAHIGVVSTVVSIGTLLIWIFYAHLLWMSFRRSERPLIVIHQAGGIGPGSSCLVVNLSRQPLHVLTIYFVLRTNGHEFGLRLNEYTRITKAEERDWAVENVMKEGPLRAGEFLSLGDFSSMLEGARADYDDDNADENDDNAGKARQNRALAERTQEFEIRVAAMFSSFGRPVGAIRSFTVTNDGNAVSLSPTTATTEQLTSFRQRRRVYRWLREARERDAGD